MTDPAERNRTTPRTPRGADPKVESEQARLDTPLRSYINELRTRVESLPDEDDALMVPPGAAPASWVATNIEAALHAAAETVPRSPSSPDSPLQPSSVPAAELSSRNVRRPHADVIERFPVELDAAVTPPLRARDRGRKSGRFVSPAGLRVSVETEGSIAAAVAHLVAEERALTAAARLSASADAVQAVETSVSVAPTDVTSPAQESLDGTDSSPSTSATTVLRGLLLFVTASIASGSAVYFLLRG